MTDKVIFIQAEGLGRGDDRLGAMLMANYLRLLGESPQKPGMIILWNAGVKLACDGSALLEYLKKLQAQGVEILACTTCLEYFELKEKLAVGKPTTMVKSIEAMMQREVVAL
ncbi:MAG: sulfurtransferase-like selenium metabolism protein YedF [Dehalococcoidales bacterium]|nr:sulfurtransferase-like selenium metabolism protein YedF [Dehalococcoidales bacterium]